MFVFCEGAIAANYFTFFYKVEEGDSFSLILKKFVKEFSIINSKTPMVKKIIKRNPHVKKWNNLAPGTTLELFISDDFMDLDKYKPYEELTLKRLSEEEEKKKLPSYPVGLKGSVFYMSSLGMFTQKADNVAEIQFRQNSPVSLGTAYTYYPKDKLYSYSFSAYFSYLMASANSLTSDTVKIDPEIGTNFYGEYRWQKYNSTIYLGPDYESFSTFNLRGLQNDKKIYVDRVGALYMTLGVAKSFSMFNKQFFTKISASKSISTSYKNNAPTSSIDASDHIDQGGYDGMKFMFYLNYKFSSRWYLHSLFKYHTMTGPSDLTTLRIGVGLGYILF
jgi:hypothetical protein